MLPSSKRMEKPLGLFLKGVSLAELWREAGALLAIGTVVIVASVLRFRKRLE